MGARGGRVVESSHAISSQWSVNVQGLPRVTYALVRVSLSSSTLEEIHQTPQALCNALKTSANGVFVPVGVCSPCVAVSGVMPDKISVCSLFAVTASLLLSADYRFCCRLKMRMQVLACLQALHGIQGSATGQDQVRRLSLLVSNLRTGCQQSLQLVLADPMVWFVGGQQRSGC